MQGSIQKRTGKRGVSWYAKYDYLDPASGKRIHKRISAKTRQECAQKLRAAIQAVETGQVSADERLTVRAFVERWLSSIEGSVRPATLRRYADLMRLHVLPTVGGVQLRRLAPLHVQELHALWREKGLSPTSCYHAHYILHRVLVQAARWRLITGNPCELVDAPRRGSPEMKTWDARQAAVALAAGDTTDLAALWRLALLCGLRRGELLGLRWDDIDLDRGSLAVRRTLSRGNGGTWELGQTKTTAGRRSVALPASCVAALRAHRDRQGFERQRLGEVWEDHGFVFTNETGGPLHVNSLVVRYRRLIAAAGVPTIRFHDLRHTCATLLLAAGIHPKVVQERLGHSDISMTLNRYSHVMPGMQQQAADALDAAIAAAS
ncbi:MAG: site-specific integrase [Chloroflexota bacterium]|nr:site-specific integrase [Chloroflexota bacterium]